MTSVTNPRSSFFDAIADQWDGWDDMAALEARLAAGLAALGVKPGETVLDVGCGTGNLTRAVLSAIGESGRVVAVDIAPRMLEVARAKVPDPRVAWHVAPAERLPVGDAAIDRAICFSVWPHFHEPVAAARELCRVLRPGGSLHVWHLSSRERINAIHASAGEAVRGDVLLPAAETADLLAGLGFEVTAAIDDADRYLVTAVRRPG
jgi:demethylmenaquinone methyltransferase/2-methoxy-6-polyprenyl-1,4-benzoquinol methylase